MPELDDLGHPTLSLLCKLGSIAVHTKEMLSPDGREIDAAALRSMLADAELVAWLARMDAQALLPKIRTRPGDSMRERNTVAT